MVDNTPFHKKAWIEFGKRHSINLTDDEYHKKISGKRNDAIFPVLFGKIIEGEEFREFEEKKESIYRELYSPYLKEVDGLSQFLYKLSDLGLKLGVATTSFEKNRIFILGTLNLHNLFAAVVGGEHAKHGKPHPEIYLMAAEKLGVEPTNCLAFEDTPSGIAAAKSAGMTVVGVLTAHSKEELRQADYFIRDFTEIET